MSLYVQMALFFAGSTLLFVNPPSAEPWRRTWHSRIGFASFVGFILCLVDDYFREEASLNPHWTAADKIIVNQVQWAAIILVVVVLCYASYRSEKRALQARMAGANRDEAMSVLDRIETMKASLNTR